MREIKGDIWDYHKKGHWIVITTNGMVRKDSACVMGRGVAMQAADRFPRLPYELGELIKCGGNHVYIMWNFSIITFPVKTHWVDRAFPAIIDRSCGELVSAVDRIDKYGGEHLHKFCMVRPGCGSGRLSWKDVKSLLEKHLDDRFVVVQR